MNGTPTLHDLFRAGGALAAGIVAAVVLRVLLGRLAARAERTKWAGDDLLVDALRGVLPPAAVAAGAAGGAAALPLTSRVVHDLDTALVALVILAATATAARVTAGLVRSVAVARSGVASSATIFVNITRITVIAVGVMVLLQTLGISIAPLLTALGVGGLAVALALQDTLSNLFAGVHILASKKVQPGDYIQLSSGEEGYVTDINWRNTVVRQLPDNLVIIPNAQLSGAIITNYHRPARQMSVPVQVGVGYDSDLEFVERVTTEVAAEVMREVPGGVPEHEPAVRFHTFGDSSIDFSVVLRANEFADQYRIKHEFIKRLHRRYRTEGIDIPFPIRTVMMAGSGTDGPAVPRQGGPRW